MAKEAMSAKELLSIIEQYVDQTSFAETLEVFADLARQKCLHIQENWQDEATAKIWRMYAKEVNRAIDRIETITQLRKLS
jgi:hypothetical protein